MSLIQIGFLTAVRNTAVALTVTRVYEETDGETLVECSYMLNGELKHFSGPEDVFVGFGDELIYRDGAFVDAYESNPDLSEGDDDEDEPDEDEEEDDTDEDEPDDDEPDADHEDVRN